MKFVAESLQSIAVTLWVGGLWTIGLVVAPLLFRTLAERSLAGTLAGQFFTVIGYVGLGCGGYVLLFRTARFGTRAFRQIFFLTAVLMLALTAAGLFGVQPILAGLREQALPNEVMQSIFRDRFAAWHGVASVLYLIECALGLVLVLGRERG